MATRRMFSKRIIESASFLRMPLTTQALYFHLGMQADDDGIVEAFMVLRFVGGSEDDLKLLHTKGFVHVLNDDLVTYICDWRENNLLRPDRKIDSRYQKLVKQKLPDVEFLESRPRADAKQPAEVETIAKITDGQRTDGRLTEGQTVDVQRTDNGRPTDSQWTAQYRVVEDRSEEVSSDQFKVVEEEPPQPEKNTEEANTVTKECNDVIEEGNNVTTFANYQKFIDFYNEKCPSLPKMKALTSDRKQRLKALLSRHGPEDILLAFEKAEKSARLRGLLNGKGYESFIADFDWIINEDHFEKILEGKYDSRGQPADSGAEYALLEADLLDNY